MTAKPDLSTQRRTVLIWGTIWLLLWVIPWGRIPTVQAGNLLALLTDTFRLGLAILLFLVPGLLLYRLLLPKDSTAIHEKGLLPISLTLSLALISIFGLIGRIGGFSFVLVKSLYVASGVVLFGLKAFLPHARQFNFRQIVRSYRTGLNNPPLILAIILAFILTFNPNLFFIDDSSYLAYLTNWQHASQLGFGNIVHEVDVIEHSRFWLALYPMSQSLLADLSGVPGILLLGSYLELFLVPFAVLTSYWFARELGLSRKIAGFSALFQVTLYTWMVGFFLPVGLWFYRNMSEDKVFAVFLLTPVYLVFAMDFIRKRSVPKGILIILAGLSIFLTHPIILFYSSAVMLFMGILALLVRQTSWREVLILVVIIIGLFLPYLYVRDQGNLMNTTEGVNLVETQQFEILGKPIQINFYGIDPEGLKFSALDLSDTRLNALYQGFRMIPIFIALAAGIIAAFHLKKGPLYWYIFTCVLLVAAAAIPYTGWIVGAIVSPRMISRASWFSPLGLGSVLILSTALAWIRAKRTKERPPRRFSNASLGMIASILFVIPIVASVILPNIPTFFKNINYYKQLALVGTFIDQHTTAPVMTVGLDYEDTQFLPGVSAQARLIYFREENVNPHGYFFTPEEKLKRIEETVILRDLSPDLNAERCEIIEQYALRFVVARENQSSPFQEEAAACGKTASIVFSTPDLILLEIGE